MAIDEDLTWEGFSVETALDRFGRVVIPKKIREHMGLGSGSMLTIEERDGVIVIKPLIETTPVEIKEGVLVFTGHSTGDIENEIRKHRDERLSGFW